MGPTMAKAILVKQILSPKSNASLASALSKAVDNEIAGSRDADEVGHAAALCAVETSVAEQKQEVWRPRIDALTSASAAVESQKRKILPKIAQALALADIEQRLTAEQGRLEDLVKRLADAVSLAGKVRVEAAPALCALVSSKGRELFNAEGMLDELVVTENSGMEIGGMIVRCSSGSVDARPSVQVRSLVSLLLGQRL